MNSKSKIKMTKENDELCVVSAAKEIMTACMYDWIKLFFI